MTNYRMREASGAGEWMMNAMTRNPEGLLLLAAGAALLMRSGRGQLARSSRPDSSRWNQAGQQYARSQDYGKPPQRNLSVNVSAKPLDALENTFQRRQTRWQKLLAHMHPRRGNMPMRPVK